MPRLSEIDELLSPAQKRRKEVERLRDEQAAKTFGPKAYVPYGATPEAKAEEAQFGTTNQSLIEARRAEGGIYTDPDVLKKRMMEDPAALGEELEAQLASLEGREFVGPRDERQEFYEKRGAKGEREFTNRPDRMGESGWQAYQPGGGTLSNFGGTADEARRKRERIVALQQELSVTTPGEGEQYRRVAKHEPGYIALAKDVGAPEALERLKADAANGVLDARTAASIEGRIFKRSLIDPNAYGATDFEVEMSLPGSRAQADTDRSQRLKEEGDAKVAQAQQEQAEKAAAKPDQLADLLTQVQTPSGPEAAPEQSWKDFAVELGIKGAGGTLGAAGGFALGGPPGAVAGAMLGSGAGSALAQKYRGAEAIDPSETSVDALLGGATALIPPAKPFAEAAAGTVARGVGRMGGAVARGVGRAAEFMRGGGLPGAIKAGERRAVEATRKAAMQAAREAGLGAKETPLAGLRAAEKGVAEAAAETQKAGTTAAEALARVGAPRGKNIEDLISEASSLVQTKLGRPLSAAEVKKLRTAATQKEMAKILKALGL